MQKYLTKTGSGINGGAMIANKAPVLRIINRELPARPASDEEGDDDDEDDNSLSNETSNLIKSSSRTESLVMKPSLANS